MESAAASSAVSSIVQTLGGGSGIDMAGLATNLAAAQFAGRIDRNTNRSETVERQISAAATLKSQILQLASSVGERIRTGDLSSQPLIANGTVASVSRGTASGGGTYSLEVTALARAQALAGPAYPAATAPTGSGTLTLRFGTIAGAVFTEDPGHAAASITIASGATLADVAGAINAAGTGVTAYLASAADGVHLMLKGQEGAANAFVLETSETLGEEGLAALAWNPAIVSDRLKSTAASAAFKLDGLDYTSAKNSVSDVVPGLSLQLTGTNPGSPTTIRFSDPSAAVSSFMQDLTTALNEITTGLNDVTNALGGDLARDPGARRLRSAFSQLAATAIMPGASPGEPATLADLGLATNRDGTFRLDAARLTATLKASSAGVAAMFTTGIRGVYATLDKLSRSTTAAGDPGTLGGSISRYSALKTQLASEKSELAEAQDKLRANLVRRFAGTDSRVGASRATLSFLKNQIDAWNAPRG